MEIWKDIQGYEGLYQVSNLGNVRSLNWGKRGCVKNLYLKKHNKGYLQVELVKGRSKKTFTVHRLVAIHFVDGYADGLVVNHINEDKQDNRAENLEWCTLSHNVRYSLDLHPERREQLKEKFELCKFEHSHKGKPYKRNERIEQLSKNGEPVRVWENAISIKHELGYNEWSITQCCNGKRHIAYGYKWQYAT